MSQRDSGRFLHPDNVIHHANGKERRVGVARARGEYGLFALAPVAAGDVLVRIEGRSTARPTRFSVQVDHNTHIDLPVDCPMEQQLDRHLWRFMNHRCEPTAMIRGRDMLALREILPLEEVTFNYNTTEYDMSEPFLCHCSSPECLGHIGGFRHLSALHRERLKPWLAPHLLHLLELEATPPVSAIAARPGPAH